jgi:mitogen-activated protein kinase 15
MWSVGCILGELIMGKAMFPGNSTLNQIERILEITGKPTNDVRTLSIKGDCIH